tara:strand:+ start:57 stop:1340 length:1284 start_codon:yes stop_codon:yes gene_type:complete
MPGTTDTVKAILTPGEFVIRKEAVDMIGAPMLNMINNMPEKGGHSNIDSLIEKATMANMKGMYGGGMVQAGPKPMGTGGMVDAYRGGGMVMDQYGHGGMVNKDMMSYKHGGKVHKNLKPVPKDNPGLGKLPEEVRNKMGYMQMGGMVEDSLMGMMGGGMANKAMKGYQEGGGVLDTIKGLFANLGRSSNPMVSQVKSDMPLMEEQIDAPMIDMEQVSRKKLGMSFDNYADAIKARNKRLTDEYGSVSGAYDLLREGQISNEDLNRERDAFRAFGSGAGLLGFQEGGMIGPPLPPEMMGQAMNQQLSDSIDMRMQNPQAGEIGVARNQAMALQDSINMNTVDSARKSLQLIKLQSLLNNPDMSVQQFAQGEFAVPSEEADSITKMVSMSRDAANARALDMMRMGMGPMSQPRDGMNGKVIELMPYYSK